MADKITIRVPFSQSVRALGRIGRVGENVSRRILFDCSSALSGRESATISCVIQRPSYDDPYLAPIEETEEAGVYSLTLRDVDVAIAGTVKIELRMLDGEEILKAAIYTGIVDPSITSEPVDPGNPMADMLDKLETAAETANEAVKQIDVAVAKAESAVTEATTAVDNANTAIDNANSAIDTANTAAANAQSVADTVQAKLDAGELNGKDGTDGADGVSPTVSIAKADGVTTVTITDKDGTHTAEIADGEKGEKGDTGATGPQGDKGDTGATGAAGADGYSPTATVTKSGDTATITVTDKSGTTTAEVKDGSDASVTKENVVSALGYTPADIPHQFCLIQEITTENSLKSIKLTNLSLTEIYVLFKQPASGYAAYNCNVNLYTSNNIGTASGIYGWWSIAGSKTNQQSMGYAQIRGNLLDANYQQMDNYIMMQTNPRVLKYIVDAGTVFTGININVDSTTFPDGTIVAIYGADA